MSIDGYIHDGSDTRLLLSNDADFDRVDAVRAGCDAILVGANTVRRDNPRLLVRSAARRAARVARGLPPLEAGGVIADKIFQILHLRAAGNRLETLLSTRKNP